MPLRGSEIFKFIILRGRVFQRFRDFSEVLSETLSDERFPESQRLSVLLPLIVLPLELSPNRHTIELNTQTGAKIFGNILICRILSGNITFKIFSWTFFCNGSVPFRSGIVRPLFEDSETCTSRSSDL